MKETLLTTIETLEGNLRIRAANLVEEIDVNIMALYTQAATLKEFREQYDNGHITLDELVQKQEALIKALPQYLLNEFYTNVKDEYTSLSTDMDKLKAFVQKL